MLLEETMKVSMGVRNHFYCMPFHLMAAWFTSQKGIGRETNDRTSVLHRYSNTWQKLQTTKNAVLVNITADTIPSKKGTFPGSLSNIVVIPKV
jgi:hypothetical protein